MQVDLKLERKSIHARKRTEAHLVVLEDFDGGRLKRQAGDALCQPADKFKHGFLDFLPDGVAVCPVCVTRAIDYGVPIPDHVDVAVPVTSAPLRPEDPPVEYTPHPDSWGGYYRWIVFAGYLRRWDRILGRVQCATCGSAIALQEGEERVRGYPLGFGYYECRQGHPIRDERDMEWAGEFVPANPGADGKTYDGAGVIEAYPWLQVKLEDEEVPF